MNIGHYLSKTFLFNYISVQRMRFYTNNMITQRVVKEISTSNEPLIDVLDDDGIRTGEVLSRKEIHRLGKVHRAVHLYLFDKTNNLLLQRRSITADHYPNKLSISLTGHIDSGESSTQTLHRELKEELGLDAASMKIEFLFSFRQYLKLAPNYTDHQFNDVYFCKKDFTIDQLQLDKQSISEIQLISFDKFRKMVIEKQNELAPCYTKECVDVTFFLHSRFN